MKQSSLVEPSRGYVLPNGRTWVSNRLDSTYYRKQRLTLQNKTIPMSNPDQQKQASTKNRFISKSLKILKNGTRVYGSSKECYPFLESGNCPNGVFCIYEHNGSTEHHRIKICNR